MTQARSGKLSPAAAPKEPWSSPTKRKVCSRTQPTLCSRSGFPFRIPSTPPFPGATLLRKLPFTAELDCKNFHIMAKHIVRTMLDLENCPLVSKVEDWLQSRMKDSKADIVEAIYCYRLRGTGNLDR